MQQHGPLNTRAVGIGSQPGSALGPIEAGKGTYFARSEMPNQYQQIPWSQAEIDAIESGGATTV